MAAAEDSPPSRANVLSASGENDDGVMLERLIRSSELTKARAYQLAVELCEAVQAVHDRHLIHGALSPRTVLVTRDWQVKLTGTRVAEAGGVSQPEAPARDADADIGALGAVIHEMFTGSPPESNGRVSRNLPPTFARVLMRCLQTDLARRYQRPAEVRAALVAALRVEKKRMAPAAGKPAAADEVPPLPAFSPPTAKPQTSAAASTGPSLAQGRSPQRPVVAFIRWLDRLFWTCLRGFLHLSIIITTLVLLVALFVMKDRITIETVESEPETETAAAPSPSSPPPQVQQPLGLGPLPPPPILAAPRVSGAPIVVPKPAQDPVAVLDAQYLNAVQWEITTALDASRLNDMPYLRSELQRLQNGLPMPVQDAPDLPARLKQLRDAYRREREKLTAPAR